MRVVSFIFFVTVLVPIGLLRKLLGISPFTSAAFRNHSSWESARRGQTAARSG